MRESLTPAWDAFGADDPLGLAPLVVLNAPADGLVAVDALVVDSREARPGGLFFAIRGEARHGADYAAKALEGGAVGIVTSLEGAMRLRDVLGPRAETTPTVVVDAPRAALARAAARLYAGQPRDVVAVTGTNGKTSVARFVAQIWERTGRPSAVFGTTGVAARNLPGGGALDEGLSHTTPEPIALHKLLARLAALGVEAAAMEASSHALEQRRCDGVALAAGAITNLTRDHLDYHPDASHYAAAKLRLFAELLPSGAAAVAHVDADIAGPALAIAQARGLRTFQTGVAADGENALRLIERRPDPTGQSLRVATRIGGRDIGETTLRLPLVGGFQADNALVAAALAIATGTEPVDALGALSELLGAPGRMEFAARRANGAGVFVDYAHTPDAVANAVAALRAHTQAREGRAGRVIIVVGAGGDRDPGKRGPMGAAASAADIVIVTDDNPRSEPPAAIRAAVRAGLTPAAAETAHEIGDRAEAILAGVDMLEPGDVLLIAGKGHERGQIVAGEVLPFDDREQARAAATALDGGFGGGV